MLTTRRTLSAVALVLFAILSVAATCRRDPHAWTPAPPSPAQGNKEFDLRADATDYNGSLLSPSWVSQPGKLPGGTAPCKDAPFGATCTSQKPRLDEATFPNALICMFEVASSIKGHANWTVASSVGEVLWLNFAADGDYNFMFFPDGDNGLTENNGTSKGIAEPERRFIELEFDSRETTTHFATEWWTTFDGIVRQHRQGEEIQKALSPKAPDVAARAAVYGLFGLDCEHNCQSEFHPIYAMAIEVNDDAKRNQWAIFVRNWGNEGFCSRFDHHLALDQQKLRLVLPRRGTRPRVDSPLTHFASTDGTIAFPEVAFDALDGNRGQIVLTFSLPAAERRADGDMLLTLEWPESAPEPRRMRFAPPPVRAAAAREKREKPVKEETERYLERLLSERKLDPGTARAVSAKAEAGQRRNQLQTTPSPVVVVDFQRPTIRPVTRVPRVKPSPEKARNDQALIDEICRAWKGEQLPMFNGRDVSALCKGKQ